MGDQYGQTFYPDKMVHEERNVYEAAIDRLIECYRTYDHVVGWYSGGKDGQLCMELQRRAMDAMGLNDQRTKFIFIDQELIEDEVISTVDTYFANPRFEGVWLAVPRMDTMVIMGNRQDVVLWDKDREWVRQPPEDAVTELEGLNVPVTVPIQQRVMAMAMRQKLGLQGSICFVNGSRFAENPTIRMVLTRPGAVKNWMTYSVEGMRGVDVAKPIYDWSMKDVFRFYYEEGVAYSAAYDINMHAGTGLRAGTPPLDSAVQEKLLAMRETYPRLFVQITTIWPELLTQQRYVEDVDVNVHIAKYGRGWSGMARYIRENITEPDAQRVAMKAVGAAKRRRELYMRNGKMKPPFYGFPMLHVWKALVGGNFRDGAIERKPKGSKEEFEFERLAAQEMQHGATEG